MSADDRGFLGIVEDEARMDRWHDCPADEPERPSADEAAGLTAELDVFTRDYYAGRIRTTGALNVGPLCERRPDERLSACVLRADHDGGCVFVRLTRDRHGAAFYRIPPGSATPEQVHEMRTRYREPTRAELAEELEWLKVFRVIPPNFDDGATTHDRPF